MKIKRVTVTPIAFRDPPLLNASGIHEPFALRSIIEIKATTATSAWAKAMAMPRRC